MQSILHQSIFKVQANFFKRLEMMPFILIGFLAAVHVAKPLALPLKEFTLFPDTTEIRRQIVQLICDGSYTFGFRDSDGTFLIEHKDADGYVTGEFGYANGPVKLSDYLSRINLARRSLGFETIGKKECERHTHTDVALKTPEVADAATAVDGTFDVQSAFLPGLEGNKTIHPERPKFFKYGEAIFRSASASASASSSSEKWFQSA